MIRTNLAKEETVQGENEFERLLDEYDYAIPKRGQILEGEIKTIQEDAIILNVGLKRAALVPARESRDLDSVIKDSLAIGDVIPIQVLRTPVGGEYLLVSIEKALRQRNWLEAEKLLSQEEAIELEVTGMNRGGLLVEFDQLEAFVPNSHVPALNHLHNRMELQNKKQKLIGSKLLVKPIEVDRERHKLVFSALRAQEDQRQERLQELSAGDIVDGKVINIVDFGIFVDLDGIDGLAHVSELDWSRVNHPADQFKLGDEIRVQVLKVDPERGRVSLSRKALLPDPWETVAEQYWPGDIIEVEVVNIVDFGVFVHLAEGVDGLIHNSELGGAPEDVKDNLEAGETVFAKVIQIDPERERASLSLRQVPQA